MVDLPSSGPDAGALTDMYEDAAVVRSALDGLDDDVLVVAHSYGGIATTEGAAGAGNVGHIVYLTAFMLDEGESLSSAVGGAEPDWYDNDGRTITVTRPEEIFFNDCSPEDAAAAAAQLHPQLTESFSQPVRNVAWRDVSTTYVICDRDNAIPVVAQEYMAQRAGEVRRMEASHSPFLSRPDEVVELITELASQPSQA
jgi:pimeloyl-ACP methyl ester carboxylesterase